MTRSSCCKEQLHIKGLLLTLKVYTRVKFACIMALVLSHMLFKVQLTRVRVLVVLCPRFDCLGAVVV